MEDVVETLRRDVRTLLAGTLGAVPNGYAPKALLASPFLFGLALGGAYAMAFCGVPLLIWEPSSKLTGLTLWASCYLCIAAIMARIISSSVWQHVDEGIIPNLSGETAAAIQQDLHRRFGRMRIAVVSLLASFAATAASAIALAHDLPHVDRSYILYLCAGFLFVYIIAARTTYVATFYSSFSRRLRQAPQSVFRLDPAHSSEIAGISLVGRQILLFWLVVALEIVTLIPLFGDVQLLVLIVVPTASFFSIGVGTIV